MRGVYAKTLIDMARSDSRVVALDCDLAAPIGIIGMAKEFPKRLIDCGIMEANMAGVAAGMSARGCIPFTHTFACFQSRKCLDQIFLSAGFADLNVKFVGSDPGILALYNGASHMGLEDMGVLRNVPNLTLLEPSDSVMLENLLRQVKDTYGLFYIRMNRKNATTIYEPATDFTIGKGLELRKGRDVTIFASGIMVEQALRAAELLAAQKIDAQVIDLFTWHPIDRDLIVRSAKETGAVVTAENHRVASGLGAAVASVLLENCPVPMERVGIGDVYGEVGELPYLMEQFHLRAEDIALKAEKAVARKREQFTFFSKF
ncbi:MAG: transketolase C-terminal domain-containing protein [Christensenella sp.]